MAEIDVVNSKNMVSDECQCTASEGSICGKDIVHPIADSKRSSYIILGRPETGYAGKDNSEGLDIIKESSRISDITGVLDRSAAGEIDICLLYNDLDFSILEKFNAIIEAIKSSGKQYRINLVGTKSTFGSPDNGAVKLKIKSRYADTSKTIKLPGSEESKDTITEIKNGIGSYYKEILCGAALREGGLSCPLIKKLATDIVEREANDMIFILNEESEGRTQVNNRQGKKTIYSLIEKEAYDDIKQVIKKSIDSCYEKKKMISEVEQKIKESLIAKYLNKHDSNLVIQINNEYNELLNRIQPENDLTAAEQVYSIFEGIMACRIESYGLSISKKIMDDTKAMEEHARKLHTGHLVISYVAGVEHRDLYIKNHGVSEAVILVKKDNYR